MQPLNDIHVVADLRAQIGADTELARLHQLAAERLPDDDPGHDLAHALRVGFWTIRIGGSEIHWREAVAAALLHDAVNVPKDDPRRAEASALSAAVAADLLPGFGFEPAAVERITGAIRDHSFSRGAVPTTPLGNALQDADRLEALGAIGVMRTFSTGVKMGARYFHADDPWAEDRELDDIRFSVDHFFRKLLKLPSTMRTETGRAEAERRAASMVIFLEQLGEELGRPIPAARR